jgi:hypothetical protein
MDHLERAVKFGTMFWESAVAYLPETRIWGRWDLEFYLLLERGVPHSAVYNIPNGFLYSVFCWEYLSPISRTVIEGLDNLAYIGQEKKMEFAEYKNRPPFFQSILNPEAVLMKQ